jgi:hypothetical protein
MHLLSPALACGLLLSLLLLSPLPAQASPPELELPPQGQTLWVEGESREDAAWEGSLTPATDGFLLLELDVSDGVTVDLDLVVAGPEFESRGVSHLPRERLVVRARAGQALAVSVPCGYATGEVPFRLGLTPLAAPEELTAGRWAEGSLQGAGSRGLLFELTSPRPERVRLRLEGGAGPEAELDLFVLDEALETIELGVLRGSDESCQTDVGQSPRYALILGPEARGEFTLHALLAPKDQPFPQPRLERFLDQLAQTEEQRVAVEALRRNPDFLAIRFYLEHYRDDANLPIRLRVVPGLEARGVERFGTFANGALTINPTIAEHQRNVQELLDTLIHEAVHALLSLPRRPYYPFGPEVLDSGHDRFLGRMGGYVLRLGRVPEPHGSYLDTHYGPSASNPERDYSDINSGAQLLIVKVIRDNMRRTGLGHETIVFQSLADRADLLREDRHRSR